MTKIKKIPLKVSRVKLAAYVPETLKKRVEFLATARSSTTSEIVTEALTSFFKNKKHLAELQDITTDNP